ncbi:hypothetical protein DUE52_15625 [Larkinella punicea]|uniref:Uncharacterized protein n=1 Tax=Larkinella punicea TaxID=2315727 RepID=A0A368JLL4_9BACT|nr:hypothetical protein DUE52_15625 [Larkinella punicea]
MKIQIPFYILVFVLLLASCGTQEKQNPTQTPLRDTTLIKEEIAVINQSLRYLNPDEPKPTWDSPYRGVMSQGLEGEPVWVGFMSGVFMPLPAHFNERVERMEADWDKRFKGVDTAYRAVFRNLLDFWNPDFPPHLDSIPVDQLPQGGPDDVMWQHWKGFPASDTYSIYAFVTPSWLELHALADEKILGFPYRKLGTLSISHVAFSQDKQLACFLYDMWGYSVHRYGVVFARKVNGKWRADGDYYLSIS